MCSCLENAAWKGLFPVCKYIAFKNKKAHGYAFLGPKLWKWKYKNKKASPVFRIAVTLQRYISGTTISYGKKPVPNIAYITFPTWTFTQFTLDKMLHFWRSTSDFRFSLLVQLNISFVLQLSFLWIFNVLKWTESYHYASALQILHPSIVSQA